MRCSAAPDGTTGAMVLRFYVIAKGGLPHSDGSCVAQRRGCGGLVSLPLVGSLVPPQKRRKRGFWSTQTPKTVDSSRSSGMGRLSSRGGTRATLRDPWNTMVDGCEKSRDSFASSKRLSLTVINKQATNQATRSQFDVPAR